MITTVSIVILLASSVHAENAAGMANLLVEYLGVPKGSNNKNVNALIAWQEVEGGGGSRTRWNPLNTQYRRDQYARDASPDGDPFPSYGSCENGVYATAQAIREFPGIVQALRATTGGMNGVRDAILTTTNPVTGGRWCTDAECAARYREVWARVATPAGLLDAAARTVTEGRCRLVHRIGPNYLTYGAVNGEVADVQRRLCEWAAYHRARGNTVLASRLDPGDIDGDYGDQTRGAVRAFKAWTYAGTSRRGCRVRRAGQCTDPLCTPNIGPTSWLDLHRAGPQRVAPCS
jgi:hypothetical protein